MDFFLSYKCSLKKGVLVCLCAAMLVHLFSYIIHFDKVDRVPAEYEPAEISDGVSVNDKMNAMMLDVPKEYIEEDDIKFFVDVTKEGVVPDSIDCAEKNVKNLNKILKSAKDFSKIIFPAGTYYLNTSSQGIDISNKSNLIICGSGEVRLINTSYSPRIVKNMIKYNLSNIFNIYGCKNIKIENMAIDYKSHTSSDGIITRVSNGKTYFSVYPEFLTVDKIPLAGGECVTSVLTADEKGFSDEIWVKDTMLLKKGYKDNEFYVPVTIGKPRDRICCRFTSGTYASPAVYIQNTVGFEAKNFSCYTCPSAVFYAPCGNSDFTFSEIKVKAEDGKQRLLASNEDCIHIEGLSGHLYVTDSIFIGIGDDALNVHSSLAVVSGIEDNKLTLVKGRTGKAPGHMWAMKGDTAEFFDQNYNSLGTAKITSFNGREAVVDKMPNGITSQNFVQNLSFNPDTVIKNCHVEFGRARALLLQTKNAVVSGCSFKDMRLCAILVSPDFDDWYESGFADNIAIIKNTFENCTTSPVFSSFGVITINNCHDRMNACSSCGKLHKNITILDNSFMNCGKNKFRAAAVQNLKSDIPQFTN